MPKRFDQTTNATAVAAADQIPFITAGGVTSYVTGDEFALSSPFSSRYGPITQWIGATQMRSSSGSPTLTASARTPMWALDASSQEIVDWSIYLPSYWATYHADLFWTNLGAGSGDARLDVGRGAFTNGETINGAQFSYGTGAANRTAPSQGVLSITRVSTSAVAADDGDLLAGYVYRVADNAGDTLANDVGIIGLLFTRES